MSSRFVSAGGAQASTSTNDEWEKAKQQIESQKKAKNVEAGTQDGGKSLYEVLQANKAAKQEAFEEATKLRNQFRALDDGEVEFLDSIRESERAKEKSVRQETEEQLDLFRKQRVAAEAAANLEETKTTTEPTSVDRSWHTSRKRRRDRVDEDHLPEKSRSSLHSGLTGSAAGVELKPNEITSVEAVTASESKTGRAATVVKGGNKKTKTAGNVGLGLSAYGSDDDDNDDV